MTHRSTSSARMLAAALVAVTRSAQQQAPHPRLGPPGSAPGSADRPKDPRVAAPSAATTPTAPQPAHADHARRTSTGSSRCGRSRPTTLGNFETTSLLRDNVLYVTGPQNLAWAIDARTGRQIWRYRRELPTGADRLLRPGQPRLRRARRQAVHGDARRAPDRARHEDRRGGVGRDDGGLQDRLCRRRIAPLVVKDKVIVGVAGGEYGIRGFIDAYDAADRQARLALLHRFPGPANLATTPGRATRGRPAARSVWVTGAYDRRAEPAVLRHRQSRPRLSQRQPQGRQPV